MSCEGKRVRAAQLAIMLMKRRLANSLIRVLLHRALVSHVNCLTRVASSAVLAALILCPLNKCNESLSLLSYILISTFTSSMLGARLLLDIDRRWRGHYGFFLSFY